MASRSFRTGIAVGLALLLVACGRTPSPSPDVALVEPPEPEPLALAFAWQQARGLPRFPGAQLAAVTATADGFVVVGVDGRPRVGGLVLTSPDGLTWTTVDDPGLQGLWLTDVAAAGDTIVAVGYRADVEPGTQAIVVSQRGGPWQAVDDAALDARPGSVDWVVAGAGQWLAGGQDFDDGGAHRRWRSTDGLVWESVDAEPFIGKPDAGPLGWLGPGEQDGGAVIQTADDGVSWTERSLPWPAGGNERPLIAIGVGATSRGALATSIVGAPCGPLASCPGGNGLFWSPDGRSWGAFSDAPFLGRMPDGFALVDDVLFATTVDGLFASRDAWHWVRVQAAPPADRDSVDIAGGFGRVVVVGESGPVSISAAVPIE